MLSKGCIFNSAKNKKLDKNMLTFYFDQAESDTKIFGSMFDPLLSFSPIEYIISSDIEAWSPIYSWVNDPSYEPPPFNTKLCVKFDIDIYNTSYVVDFGSVIEQRASAFLESLNLLEASRNLPLICYANSSGENQFNVPKPSFVLTIYTVLTEEQAQALEALFVSQVRQGQDVNWSYDFFDENILVYMLKTRVTNRFVVYYRYDNCSLETGSRSCRRRLLIPSIPPSLICSMLGHNRSFFQKIQLKISGINYSYNVMQSWAEGFIANVRLYYILNDFEEGDAFAYTYVDSSNNLILDIYFDSNSILDDFKRHINLLETKNYLGQLNNTNNLTFQIDYFEKQIPVLPNNVKDNLSAIKLCFSSDKLSYKLNCVYATTSSFFAGPACFYFNSFVIGFNSFKHDV